MRDVSFLKENGVDVDKSLELFGDIEMYNDSIIDFINDASKKLEQLKTYKVKPEEVLVATINAKGEIFFLSL